MESIPFGTMNCSKAFSPVAIVVCRQSSAAATTTILSTASCDVHTCKAVYDKSETVSIRVARQILIPEITAVHALRNTTASGLLVIELHLQCLSHLITLAPRRTTNVSPCLPFYVTVGKFLDKPRYLPRHMVIAHTEHPPPSVYRCCRTSSHSINVVNPKKRKYRASPTMKIAPEANDTVEPITQKVSVRRAIQIERHVDVQDQNMELFLHGWCQKIGVADKYGSYQTRFFDTFSEFYHM